MIVTKAHLVSSVKLTPFVYKAVLKPEEKFSFQAGQYIEVVMGEDDKRPFSIANPPHEKDLIELHVGATPENPYAYEVMQRLEKDKALDLVVAKGDAFLQPSKLEAILIAGGTGYSYTKSILLDILHTQPERKVTLYWGAKHASDLYESDALNLLAQNHKHFTYVPVVEHPDKSWKGETGIVHKTVMAKVNTFRDKQVYVAGRFEMAKVIKQDLSELGMESTNIIGDAFAFV